MDSPVVLIVDDYPKTLELLQMLLADSGLTILTATSGKAAKQLIGETRPDLILLDILIPDLDGYQLCSELKANPVTADIPVIFLTALSNREDILRGLRVGAVDYITKPFDLEEVSLRIKIHLELQSAKETIVRLNKDLSGRNAEYEKEVAQAVQFITAILPPPMVKPVGLDYKFLPSQRLGGDTINYFFLDEEHIAIYLLDVSGHGLVSALLSMSLNNVLRSQSLPGIDFLQPTDVLNDLNKKFRMELQDGKYFTIWYGVYNIKTKTLTYASGGHAPPILITTSENRKSTRSLEAVGLPIGLFDSCQIQEFSTTLKQNDALYIFSDGVFEIESAEGLPLGYDGLKSLLLQQHMKKNVSFDRVFEKICEYNAGKGFDDDFSLILFSVRE